MICENCNGKGFVFEARTKWWETPKHLRPSDERPEVFNEYLLCMECNGSGVGYCCEGSNSGGSCDGN